MTFSSCVFYVCSVTQTLEYNVTAGDEVEGTETSIDVISAILHRRVLVDLYRLLLSVKVLSRIVLLRVVSPCSCSFHVYVHAFVCMLFSS